jgi:hypothetical protein
MKNATFIRILEPTTTVAEISSRGSWPTKIVLLTGPQVVNELVEGRIVVAKEHATS